MKFLLAAALLSFSLIAGAADAPPAPSTTGAVVFEVNGDPAVILFVRSDGAIAYYSVQDCLQNKACVDAFHAMQKKQAVEILNVKEDTQV
jgi:hypothetical protein